MLGKSTHLQVIPQQSTQNTANLSLQTCEQNQWTFFIYPTFLSSFVKVSVPVQSIIPCCNQYKSWEPYALYHYTELLSKKLNLTAELRIKMYYQYTMSEIYANRPRYELTNAGSFELQGRTLT